MPRYDSFIMRTWSDGGKLLHGYIVHVATNQQLRFTTLRRIPGFIQGQLRTDGLREGAEGHQDSRPLDSGDSARGPAE